ncbi:hypothetical protein KA005_21020, partial [bacterium]|nr:hypothetical protein [bacterium]
MAATWIDLLSAAASGGIIVKGLDYIYSEFLRRTEASQSAKSVVEKHLDPILKAADELVGKVRSLAQNDFKELHLKHPIDAASIEKNIPITSTLYLIGHFWARVQILRKESIYMDLGADKKGSYLQSFIYSLESSHIRIVDRAWQRGIGESLICYRGNELDTLTFYEFLEKYHSDDSFRDWFSPVQKRLEKINHKKYRQRLLVYGSVIHALLNMLDPSHVVTRKRPSWANKLSKKSRRELEYRIFGVYLPFVKEPR